MNDKTLGYTIMAATILIMAGYFVWSFAPWLGASFAWLTPKKVRQLNVTGTRDIITVDYITQQITVENNLRLTQPHLPYREPLYLELESFTDAVRNGTPPEVTGEDGLQALQICEAALESSRTGKQVKLA